MKREILLLKLKHVCDRLKKTVGYEKDQWNLDYSSIYGGYVIVEYQENGGEHHPLLRKRLSASKMADCLDMTLDALRLIERE